ncbi:alpha/beta hydrolase [Paraburkholderia sp. J12]|uniref:alpha/beta fold hydrolase n=1 Tax=Paraburkholderia sp. J12 TaxID=2805432 RepID=UPI002ABD2B88|nr:alpha/beta hydrolase [Paraburkholderia sp. J12]
MNLGKFLAASMIGGAVMAGGGAAADTQTQPVHLHNIVLVHGAWADGSSWDKIIPLLEKKGFHVTAVHLPFTTLEADAAAVKRAVALEDGPVLLVGHSYGGAVITEAGNDPKVAALVYVAAFAPDVGQSAGDLNGSVPPTRGAKEFRPDANGYLKLTDKGIAEDFAQDLSTPEKKILAATQGQTSGPNELGAKVSAAAWKEKPTFYIVADQDRMISPDLEKIMAAQMHAKTIHIASSHVPMLSHPAEVAAFISEAAGGN